MEVCKAVLWAGRMATLIYQVLETAVTAGQGYRFLMWKRKMFFNILTQTLTRIGKV